MPDPIPEGPGFTAVGLRPLSGDEGTGAYCVNDAGVIVGESGSRPVRWDRDGHPTPLPILDGFSGGRAVSVNAEGVIAGSLLAGEHLRPVCWRSDGRVRALELPDGAISGTACRVNARGSVLGNAMWPGYRWRALRWEPGGETVELATLPGDGETQGQDLNGLDEVVGSARTGTGVRTAVRWTSSGRISTLPPPRRATACGITDSGAILGDGVVWNRDGGTALLTGEPEFSAGQVVRITGGGFAIGWGMTADRHGIGARWDRDGRPTVLRPLPSDVASTCYDIDEAGTVVGESVSPGTVRPVRWDADATPVPLPSPPGITATVAQHINAIGTVIIGSGFAADSSAYHGIAWHRS
ncbi:hypothetical protein [Amycolatopsis sp. TNS106]|uniref:hypothetical protein n=1 Tax=Amycolatopsis sp. TNS106 TaxID=2861750 RepID=UPI001C55E435|nr:hypothetical protein [Amycolatopsis sp. TNS106]QXV55885.1 hypothetical protein CVV72_01840 [Amycolatopsis sp. TNS106]